MCSYEHYCRGSKICSFVLSFLDNGEKISCFEMNVLKYEQVLEMRCIYTQIGPILLMNTLYTCCCLFLCANKAIYFRKGATCLIGSLSTVISSRYDKQSSLTYPL